MTSTPIRRAARSILESCLVEGSPESPQISYQHSTGKGGLRITLVFDGVQKIGEVWLDVIDRRKLRHQHKEVYLGLVEQLGVDNIASRTLAVSELEGPYIGRGIGWNAYLEAIRNASEHDSPEFLILGPNRVENPGSTSKQAEKVWARLYQKFPRTGDFVVIKKGSL